MPDGKPIIAIATGDPSGIGPEVSIKAALDDAVFEACHPILVSDPGIIDLHAKACGIEVDLHVTERADDADWDDGRLNVLACYQSEAVSLEFGATDAVSGRASLAFTAAAIKAAWAGEVSAVVAAPQNETSIALAGIDFDGYPSFVARETNTDPADVFLMLCYGDTKIVHCTLHRSVKTAIAMITREHVLHVIRAAHRILRKLGVEAPRIAVSGLNPHAGEGGLFGTEEIEIIAPAIETAIAAGIDVTGPIGADTMYALQGIDAFIVMLHDQGHIAAKLMAPNATAALTIGTPILFSSVAHGSAHDIAGKGIASPQAMISALLRLAQTQRKPATAAPR
jgi:4-hydroxy-L-threonine phosphate dehydrogenase PdxA